ncbi:MAG TPA: glycosyltransferase family 4 protein [Alkalispirochaeta sp.]|nr:glycosyltransferase family 4 protein [Alkalispirochaeta sp.]
MPQGQRPTPILHIITRLANGGAAENTIYSVNGLDRSRWAVDVAIGGEPGADETDQVEKLAIAGDVTVHRIPSLVRNPGPGEVRALSNLRRLIRTGGYRIVHTHGAKAGILGRMAARKEGVPVLINGIHGHSFSPQMNPLARVVYRSIEKRVARYTTHFVSVGDDLRQQYLTAGVGTPERFSVIHSGMELDRFIAAGGMGEARRAEIRAELGVPAEAVVYANISRMEPRKGHRYFLEAAAQVVGTPTGPQAGSASATEVSDGRDPWFVIVGDGPEESALRRQAQELGIGHRVVFTGYRGDVENMFAMSDVVVLTSLWEGLPRVLVQAAATGRPAISFACDGAGEVIENDENGWVVPMRDVAAVANRMGQLRCEPELRRHMGEAGRAKVNTSWTVEAMVEQIDQLYQRLLGR